MRTTVNIDDPILDGLKAIQDREGKSLSRVVSDLLIVALNERKTNAGSSPEPFDWITQSMEARVDVADREAVYDRMDEDRSR